MGQGPLYKDLIPSWRNHHLWLYLNLRMSWRSAPKYSHFETYNFQEDIGSHSGLYSGFWKYVPCEIFFKYKVIFKFKTSFKINIVTFFCQVSKHFPRALVSKETKFFQSDIHKYALWSLRKRILSADREACDSTHHPPADTDASASTAPLPCGHAQIRIL